MASVFSGKAGRDSAVWTGKMATQQMEDLQRMYGIGREEADALLQRGYGRSVKDLKTGYKQSRKDIGGAETTARGYIMDARGDSLDAVRGGYGAALADVERLYGQGAQTLQGAAGEYDPLIQRGMTGYDMYMASLGLNGPEGRAAAEAAFKEGPGYQWQVDEATRGAQRAANRIGGSFGGNATNAVTRLASNLANQEYGNWQGHLQGFQGATQNAVTGKAGVLNNLANLYQNQGNVSSQLQANQGKDLASVYTNAGQQLAQNEQWAGGNLSNLATNQGQNMASLDYTHGQSLAGNALNLTNNLAGATNNFYSTLIPAGQQGMMAGQTAAQNRMGAIMGGVQMLGQALGAVGGMGMPGGGTIGGSLFSKLWPGGGGSGTGGLY